MTKSLETNEKVEHVSKEIKVIKKNKKDSIELKNTIEKYI